MTDVTDQNVEITGPAHVQIAALLAREAAESHRRIDALRNRLEQEQAWARRMFEAACCALTYVPEVSPSDQRERFMDEFRRLGAEHGYSDRLACAVKIVPRNAIIQRPGGANGTHAVASANGQGLNGHQRNGSPRSVSATNGKRRPAKLARSAK